MVGGGVPPKPGEITRAHGGALFLDEMMEFRPSAIEALREALSQGEVTVTRGLRSETFQSDFMLVGTTNLCPCGRWIPGQDKNCGYSQKRCLSTLQKLSGPLLDRIQTFFFFDGSRAPWRVKVTDLEKNISRAQMFQKERGHSRPNRLFQEDQLTGEEGKLWACFLESLPVSSARRRQAWVSVARTLADLSQREKIQEQDLREAYELTVQGYEKLQKWGAGSD